MRTIRAEQVKDLFAGNIRKLLLEAPRDYERIYEIRLRVGRPVFLCYDGGEKFLRTKDVPYLVTRQDLKETLEYISGYSLYACEDELRQGYISVQGGHRVGVTGKVILDRGNIRSIKYISCINVRLAHQILGCADAVMPFIRKKEKICHTLLISPPGCGKTTLLSLIAGLLLPEEGEILLNGKRLQEQSNNPIGYMLQKDHLLEWRTIWKNIQLGLEIQGNINSASTAYANSLLKNYGLYDFKDKRPCELSGGMRQRAALIRTLVLNPTLLLLDEPFSALDYQTRLKVADDIGMIIKQEEKTAILVTHDLSEAVSLANRVIVLSERPAQIAAVVPLEFEESLTPFERRAAPQFKDYFNIIWKELNHDE